MTEPAVGLRLTLQLTNYWIVSTEDPSSFAEYLPQHPDPRMLVKLTNGRSVFLPDAFLAAVQMEGCGRIHGGCLCYADEGWTLLPGDRFPWGVDARGLPLVPFESVAVDRGVIPLGSWWRIEPGRAVILPDGRTWDGLVTAADVGGGIKGMHMDLFTGYKHDRVDGHAPDPWMVDAERIA